MNVHKIFLFLLGSSILFIPISVSISQLALFLSFVLYLFDSPQKRFKPTTLFLFSISLFSIYLFSYLSHIFIYGKPFFIPIGKTEFKDIFLFFAFVIMYNIDKEDLPKIEKYFWITFWILLLTGLASIFTPIRFSRLINDLFRESNTWKFTHHYGNIGPIGIYLPIGLMNTHLTFGGQLLLLSPFFIVWTILKFQSKLPKKEILFSLTTWLSLILLILLNNARSAMTGLILCLILALVDLYFVKKTISPSFFWKTIIIPPVLLGILFSVLLLHPTSARFIKPLFGDEKHTDSGRTFIWNSTFQMITKNPALGIGPGKYLDVVEVERKQLSEENKELLFFYEITQRGHAHNDFLHISAIAGLPAGISFLLVLSAITYYVFSLSSYSQYSIFFYGLIGFFIAGLFQCYFQDDEVVILFWFLAGFLNKLYLLEGEAKV